MVCSPAQLISSEFGAKFWEFEACFELVLFSLPEFPDFMLLWLDHVANFELFRLFLANPLRK